MIQKDRSSQWPETTCRSLMMTGKLELILENMLRALSCSIQQAQSRLTHSFIACLPVFSFCYLIHIFHSITEYSHHLSSNVLHFKICCLFYFNFHFQHWIEQVCISTFMFQVSHFRFYKSSFVPHF